MFCLVALATACPSPLSVSPGHALTLPLPRDFPFSDSWAKPDLIDPAFLGETPHPLRPTQVHVEPETAVPEVTPEELPNGQGCGFERVSAEGYSFTWELNYSSGAEDGRRVAQAWRGEQEAVACSLESLCRVSRAQGRGQV